jgi:hypothetical protein
MQPMSEPDRANAALAHDVVNKLSAIVGLCDLLIEKMEHGSEAASQLTTILDLASTAAADLKAFQRHLAARIQRGKSRQDEVA